MKSPDIQFFRVRFHTVLVQTVRSSLISVPCIAYVNRALKKCMKSTGKNMDIGIFPYLPCLLSFGEKAGNYPEEFLTVIQDGCLFPTRPVW
jgi:hypothetical protein